MDFLTDDSYIDDTLDAAPLTRQEDTLMRLLDERALFLTATAARRSLMEDN